MVVTTRCLLVAACLAAAGAVVFENGPFRENAVCEVQGRPLGSCLTAESCSGVGGVPSANCGLPGANSSGWRCCQPSAQPPASRPDYGARSRQACRQFRVASPSQSCDNFQLLTADREVRQGDFPYFAGVGYAAKSGGGVTWNCGGGLISENFVLTAAICAEGSAHTGKPTKVRLGALNFSNKDNVGGVADGVQVLDVAAIFVHPEFSMKAPVFNDIALLRLAEKVKFSRAVQPACLYPEERIPVDRAVAAGFGTDGQLGNPGTLGKVDIPLVPNHTCRELYKNILSRDKEIDLTTQFCAGEKGRDTCTGDSGAPLVVKEGIPTCSHQIIGLASFGPSNCGSIPGVYTKVHSYLPWIEKIVWG